MAGSALLRRGVAQQPSRVPDLCRARSAPQAARSLRVGDPGARAHRTGLGRRASDAGATSNQEASEPTSVVTVGPVTLPLRRLLVQALPDRPFQVELWDGTTVPPTNGSGGPTFCVR